MVDFIARLAKNKIGYSFALPRETQPITAFSLVFVEVRQTTKPYTILIPTLQSKVQRSPRGLHLAVPALFITGGILKPKHEYKLRILPPSLKLQ